MPPLSYRGIVRTSNHGVHVYIVPAAYDPALAPGKPLTSNETQGFAGAEDDYEEADAAVGSYEYRSGIDPDADDGEVSF